MPKPPSHAIRWRSASYQVRVAFVRNGRQFPGINAAVIFQKPVLPFKKLGDGLRLDADFHAAQAGQQQVHFVFHAGGGALAAAWGLDAQFHPAPGAFQQAPARGQFLGRNQAGACQIETLAAQGDLRVLAEGFEAVGEEVGAAHFAFHHYRTAFAFPADGVGHLAAGASLFRKHHAAAVAAQPVNGELDQLGVGHGGELTIED